MKAASKGMAVGLTAVLAVAAAGCSKAGEPAPGATGTGSGGAKSGAPVKIEYFQQKVETVDTVNKLIEKFQQKYPDIKVEQNNVPNAINVWTMRLSTKDAPDVFTHYSTAAAFQKAARDGSVVDLTNDPLMKNVKPAFAEMTKIDDKVYLLPIAIGTFGVYYNTDMFKELGLTIPTTYDELLKTAEKIKAAGKQPFIFPDKNFGTVRQEVTFKMGLEVPNVEKFLDDVMSGKAHITDNADIRKFAQKMLDLRKYGQKDTLGTERDDAVREFAMGKSAMYFQGIWSIQPMKKVNPSLKFSMFPMPAEKSADTKLEVFVDTAIGLPKGGKREAEARKFVEYMASPETVQQYVDESQYPSAINGVKNNIAEIKSLNDLIESGKVYPSVSRLWLPGMTDDVGKATQELFASGNVDEYLKKMDSIFFNKKNQ